MIQECRIIMCYEGVHIEDKPPVLTDINTENPFMENFILLVSDEFDKREILGCYLFCEEAEGRGIHLKNFPNIEFWDR